MLALLANPRLNRMASRPGGIRRAGSAAAMLWTRAGGARLRTVKGVNSTAGACGGIAAMTRSRAERKVSRTSTSGPYEWLGQAAGNLQGITAVRLRFAGQ